MTTIDYATPAPRTLPSLGRGMQTLFGAPALFAKRRFVAFQTSRQLSGLTDAQLDDIGVVRGDIGRLSENLAARTTF